MTKSAEAFRTISEVADDLGIPKHVLRFWEVKFAQIRPMKRGGGRRYYRPEDLELLKGIQHLLHREGYTIKGVQKILREQGVDAVKTHALLGAVTTVPIGEGAPSVATAGAGFAEGLRLMQPAPRSAKPDAKRRSATATGAGRAQLLASVIVELETCRSILRGEPVPVATASNAKRNRAGGNR